MIYIATYIEIFGFQFWQEYHVSFEQSENIKHILAKKKKAQKLQKQGTWTVFRTAAIHFGLGFVEKDVGKYTLQLLEIITFFFEPFCFSLKMKSFTLLRLAMN